MKQVFITIEFPVEDKEVECFLEDIEKLDSHEVLALVDEQKDTMRDWLREATYNRSVSYEIREPQKPHEYFHYTRLAIGKFKLSDLFRFHKQRKTQATIDGEA